MIHQGEFEEVVGREKHLRQRCRKALLRAEPSSRKIEANAAVEVM